MAMLTLDYYFTAQSPWTYLGHDRLVRMAEAGFAGTTVSFVNFKDELPTFIETVLPLLCDAGLRH